MKSTSIKKAIVTLVMMAFCYMPLFPQQTAPYTVAVHGSVTTSSRLFYNPNDADEISRNQSLGLDGVWGIGIDLRRVIKGNNIFIGINAEYIRKSETFTVQQSNGKIVDVQDGYIAVPVELTGYFNIPIASDPLRMYLGGGIGVYFGERRYEYAEVPALVMERKPGFGIHVLSGFEYELSDMFALRSELKFREVQFESTNFFPVQHTASGLFLPYASPFVSRISIDGIAVTLGAIVRF